MMSTPDQGAHTAPRLKCSPDALMDSGTPPAAEARLVLYRAALQLSAMCVYLQHRSWLG